MSADPHADRLSELRDSARGWHGIQLAVIGFIGLCGVLKADHPAIPKWVQTCAGVLALAALAAACLATYLVGRAAWPLYDVRRATPPAAEELPRTSRRITSGLALTFAAVAMVALAGASAWWPTSGKAGATAGGSAAAAVELQAQGTTVCGRLADSQAGTIGLTTAERTIAVPIANVTALRPVDAC